jgi:hypothetical protein
MTCRDFLGGSKEKSTDVCISPRRGILVVPFFSLPIRLHGMEFPISAYGSAVRGFIWREKRSRFTVDGVRIRVRLDVYGFSFERRC